MIQRLKNWLIVKLGGYTKQKVDNIVMVVETTNFKFKGDTPEWIKSLPIKPKRAKRKATTRSRKG